MLYFPNLSVEFQFSFGVEYRNQITRFANGRRQAKPLIEKGLRHLQGRIPATMWDNSEEIRSFVDSVRGSLTPFYIFNWKIQQFTNLLLGTGDGATGVLYLPFMGNSNDDVARISNLTEGGTPLTGGGVNYSVDWQTYPTPIAQVTRVGTFWANGADVRAKVLGRERIPVEMDGSLQVDHPLRSHKTFTKPADFYVINVTEVPMASLPVVP